MLPFDVKNKRSKHRGLSSEISQNSTYSAVEIRITVISYFPTFVVFLEVRYRAEHRRCHTTARSYLVSGVRGTKAHKAIVNLIVVPRCYVTDMALIVFGEAIYSGV